MAKSQRREAIPTSSAPEPGTGTPLTWRGIELRVPEPDQIPLEAVEAEEDGKALTALRLILGNEQYKQLRTVATTAADLVEFTETLMQEAGLGNR